MADLRYPIGPFRVPESSSGQDLKSSLDTIAALPANLRAALAGLTEKQLGTPYREGGWTVRQVVHHLADSHMNAYVRMRKALTEDNPPIVAYDEKAWAELPDARDGDVRLSVLLLDSLHQRWAALLRTLGETQWERTFQHPERGAVRLDFNAHLYAWHCRHHLAHITSLRERQGW